MTSVIRLEIEQDLPGFEGFFGTWIVTGKPVVLVDTGPARTSDRLLAGLDRLGIHHVDWILLTHIHIDHCGGTAALSRRFPEARVVCHQAGLAHLVDPTKLWNGSKQVLGELADLYGPPPPVATQNLVSHKDAHLPGLSIIETPGHAPHHVSYVWRDRLFAGEAGGNFFYVDGKPYLRPATPPRFYLKTMLAGVDRLLELPEMPIYYAHFESAPSSRDMLTRFRRQLLRWEDIIAEIKKRTPTNHSPEEVERLCVESLIARDPEIAAIAHMSGPAADREKRFIRNSVRGYWGYLEESEMSREK
jgi:glyoxylase-like metal-dependent hydrolase (beta-lactamase superfamily II)